MVRGIHGDDMEEVTEFKVIKVDVPGSAYRWIVEWHECDCRAVAYCANEYEAKEIARLLNENGVAEMWYARAAKKLSTK